MQANWLVEKEKLLAVTCLHQLFYDDAYSDKGREQEQEEVMLLNYQQ